MTGPLFPGNYSTVWIRGRFITMDGQAVRGKLSLFPTVTGGALVNRSAKLIMSSAVFSADTGNDGYVAVQVPATNDPDLTPINFTYSVTTPIGQMFSIVVPYDTTPLNSVGDPLHGQPVIELIDMVPVGSSGGVGQLLRGIGIQSMVDNGAGGLLITYTDLSTTTITMPDTVAGPPGPTGPQGPLGPTGPTGATGPAGGGATKLVDLTDLTTTGAAIGKVVAATAVSGGAPTAFGLVDGSAPATFRPESYGAVGNGTTDDTTAVNNAIAAAQAAGGGTVLFDAKTYRCNGAITPVWDSTAVTQKPVRLTSNSPASFDGFWRTAGPVNGGAVLDLRYDGTDGQHNAKIDTRGVGTIEIDHLTLKSGGSDNWPFFHTVCTTPLIHDNVIMGNAAGGGASCTQDALILGGGGYVAASGAITSGSTTLTIGSGDPPFTSAMVGWTIAMVGAGAGSTGFSAAISAFTSSTQVTLSAPAGATVSGARVTFFDTTNKDRNAPFQGYGAAIYGNFFSHVRRCVWGRIYANSVVVQRNTISVQCGAASSSIAAIMFEGVPGGGNTDAGNVVRDNLIEQTHYSYGVILDYANANIIDGNSFWDASAATACVRCTSTASGNLLIAGNNLNGGSPFVDEQTAGSNTIIAATQQGFFQFAGGSLRFPGVDYGISAPNNLLVTTPQAQIGGTTNYATLGPAGTSDVYLMAQGSNGNINLYLRPKGTGQVVFDQNSHLGSVGTAPTVAASAGAGTSPPAPSMAGNATDLRGSVSIGTGTSPAAGDLAAVAFNKIYSGPPYVSLTAMNAATAALGLFVTNVAAGGFRIAAANAPAASQAGTTYQVTYQVFG